MKRIVMGLLGGILFLTACGQQVSPNSTPAISTPTGEISIVPNLTSTPLPSKTPREPRNEPTTTPIPSSTTTPTFDVSTIVTATPAPKAECPIIQENANINLSNFDDYYPDLMTALNQGASIHAIIDVFEKEINEHFSFPIAYTKIEYEIIDVTNDGVPEIILPGDPISQLQAMILGCVTGKYQILYSRSYQVKDLHLLATDANQNGISEILIGDEICSNSGCSFDLSIIEWRTNKFEEILNDASAYAVSWGRLQVENIDNDDLKEIYWQGGVPMYTLNNPLRKETHIYKWNGFVYVPSPIIYEPPIFRFQAIQDADIKTKNGKYDEASLLYQDVILNAKLDWWSLERSDYERLTNPLSYDISNPPTFPPRPIEDLSEYPRLAAYAYYRIMLLHLVQGHESDATTVYSTLQQKFGNDQYGHPYVEMATAFWEAFQSTHKMYDGCAAAIQYAVEHPAILIPLGSDYHGAQSHQYKPEDVCPFR